MIHSVARCENREKVEIPMLKNFITLRGQGRNTTVVVWDDTASAVGSTYRSATVAVDAQYFAAVNITFQVHSVPNPVDSVQKLPPYVS